jgi:tetratricopeptide (TPR) repeat protein
LARLFADEVAAGLPPSLRSPSSDTQGWLTEEECARRLGYTDTQRHEIANLILRRLEEPIYSRQLDHVERLSLVREEIAGLRGAVKPTALRRALEVCRTALESAPDDWRLHEMTARLLSDLNDHAAAEIEWRRVSQLIPHAAGPHTEIGKLQQQQGNAQGAVVAFRRAVEVNPDYAEAHAQLGAAYGQMGKRSEAIRSFRKALQLDPTRSEAMEGLARLSAR